MRQQVWRFVRRHIAEGQLLPWWALVIRCLLFPIDFLYWRMSGARGYQWQTDTWHIHGVTYSDCALRQLALAQGAVYRVTNRNGTVILEEVRLEDKPPSVGG